MHFPSLGNHDGRETVTDTLWHAESARRCVIVFFAYTLGLIGALYVKDVIDRLFIESSVFSSSIKWRTLVAAVVVVGVALVVFCSTRITMHGNDVDRLWEKRRRVRA